MTVLGFDTETKGLDWFDPSQQAFLASWADDTQADGYVGDVTHEDRVAAFRRSIDRAGTLVAHNLPFDVHQTRETLGIDLLKSGKRLVDTAVLARVVLPERRMKMYDEGAEDDDTTGFKLKSLARTYLRDDAKDGEDAIAELAKAAKIKLKATGGYYDTWRAYPAEMEHYAALDAEYVRDLLPILEAKVGDRFRRVWELEQAAQPVLIRAEQRGVMVDQTKVSPLKVQYEEIRDRTHATVTTALGEAALEGPDALREALLEHGVPLHRRTETGKLATHKFALQEFEGGFPVIASLLEYRQADKFLSTYIGPMVDREVVHTSFSQVGAWTGRMSCSRPNMQNIPVRAGSEVRELFVPRPGHVFVVSDYDSIEIRLLAYYLYVQWYRDMIRHGLDPHAWMASQIWGGDPEHYAKGGPNDQQRSDAKNVLFAISYGAGARRVADMLQISYEEARELVRRIKKSLPGYYALNKRIRAKVEAMQHVNTLFGRKQPVKRDKAYVGLNAVIQGSAADVMKQGVVNTAAAVAHLGAMPVLFVHDEILTECPVEYAAECLVLQDAAMEAAYDLDPPLAVTGKVCATSYAEAK